jgi:hypothetical protein
MTRVDDWPRQVVHAGRTADSGSRGDSGKHRSLDAT